MKVSLAVTAGPHAGQSFAFEEHDAFMVGRGDEVHFRLANDQSLSRKHFLLEVNPPLCRLLDLNSKSGTKVNGRKIDAPTDLKDGDAILAGQSAFRVRIEAAAELDPNATVDPVPAGDGTLHQHAPPGPADCPVIPGYAIKRELGRGGMGVVYEAERKSDGAPVALKTLLPAVAPTRPAVERFLREARILEDLNHPHIVAFRDMGEVNRVLWFAMEFVPGTDASAQVKKNGPLPPGEACRLGLQLLDALTYAHAKKFVHRDIKPSNLLLTDGPGGPRVKLSDFGLARTYQASQLSGLTMAGESGGTPLYMPPEQVLNFRDVRPPADQYSAAATLYFLMTGKPVFDPEGPAISLMMRILEDEPVPVRKRRPEVPEGLAAALHRALARKPEGRYPDCHAFAKALKPFAAA
jgi:serine/threonine protein kinase